jgi:hypothetical protein
MHGAFAGLRKWAKPNQVSGLVAWHRADDPSNNIITGKVFSLNDATGNGWSLTNVSNTFRPIYTTGARNGLPVVSFSAAVPQVLRSTPNFSLTGDPAYTIVFCGAPTGSTATSATNAVMGWGLGSVALSATGIFSSLSAANEFEIQYGGSNTARFTAPSYTAAPQTWICTKASGAITTTSALRRNGVSISVVSGSSTNTPNIAAGVLSLGTWTGASATSWTGDFYEMAIYSRVLTTTEQQLLETYLNTKWTIF